MVLAELDRSRLLDSYKIDPDLDSFMKQDY
jgi:hypothetical protein